MRSTRAGELQQKEKYPHMWDGLCCPNIFGEMIMIVLYGKEKCFQESVKILIKKCP